VSGGRSFREQIRRAFKEASKCRCGESAHWILRHGSFSYSGLCRKCGPPSKWCQCALVSDLTKVLVMEMMES